MVKCVWTAHQFQIYQTLLESFTTRFCFVIVRICAINYKSVSKLIKYCHTLGRDNHKWRRWLLVYYINGSPPY